MKWEYRGMSFAHSQNILEVCEAINPLGQDGWELVCVLDQSSDPLGHRADARMLLFKRPISLNTES